MISTPNDIGLEETILDIQIMLSKEIYECCVVLDRNESYTGLDDSVVFDSMKAVFKLVALLNYMESTWTDDALLVATKFIDSQKDKG